MHSYPMTTYIIELSRTDDAAGIAASIRETVAATGRRGEIDRDRSIIEIDQTAYDVLASLAPDADGHIDDNGDLWIGGASYPVGTL